MTEQLRLIPNPQLNRAQLDSLWRDAGWRFLIACFQGRSPLVIHRLADEYRDAREATLSRHPPPPYRQLGSIT